MDTLSNLGDSWCAVCISAMQYGVALCESVGISYGLLNVLLFIIIQPLCILLFALAACRNFLKNKTKRNLHVANSFFAVGALLTVVEAVFCFICLYGVLK